MFASLILLSAPFIPHSIHLNPCWASSPLHKIPIHLTTVQLITRQTHRIPLRFTQHIFESISIHHCHFEDTHSQNVAGGAILCFGDLSIKDTSFVNCTSTKAGGSIASFFNIRISRCVFQRSFSYGAAAILSDSQARTNFSISRSSFVCCQSNGFDGIVIRRSFGQIDWTFLNLSLCSGRGHFGCLTIRQGICEFDSISIWSCYGSDFNSGLTIIESPQFSLRMGTFANLTRGADVVYGAVALHVDHVVRGSIEKCNFLKCNGRGQPSICVRWGTPLVFKECCFVESDVFERGGNHLIIWKNCRFTTECGFIPSGEDKSQLKVSVYIIVPIPFIMGGLWLLYRRRNFNKEL
jgi:hypothetical protein